MADTWGVTVFAAQRRTNLEQIFGDQGKYFAHAEWIPDVSMRTVREMISDISNDYKRNGADHDRYGYVTWNPAGALNYPVPGNSPGENPAGWWMFRPSAVPAPAVDKVPPVTQRGFECEASCP
jgi:hypothetical protein